MDKISPVAMISVVTQAFGVNDRQRLLDPTIEATEAWSHKDFCGGWHFYSTKLRHKRIMTEIFLEGKRVFLAKDYEVELDLVSNEDQYHISQHLIEKIKSLDHSNLKKNNLIILPFLLYELHHFNEAGWVWGRSKKRDINTSDYAIKLSESLFDDICIDVEFSKHPTFSVESFFYPSSILDDEAKKELIENVQLIINKE